MILLLDHDGHPRLLEQDDLGRFHVDAQGRSATQLARAAARYGALDYRGGTHALVGTGSLRGARGANLEAVEALVFAAERCGWLDPEDSTIRVHVEGLAAEAVDTLPAAAGSGSSAEVAMVAGTTNTVPDAAGPGPSSAPTGAGAPAGTTGVGHQDAADPRRAPAPDLRSLRIGVVGLGAQGTGIARGVLALGHQLVGAVDVGPKVGLPLSQALGVTGVRGTVEEGAPALLARRPDVVIVAAAGSRELVLSIAREYLRAGLAVLTLNQDLFTYEASWADEMDALCRRTGGRALATGVQVAWWVQLPALFAATSLDITAIRYDSKLSLDLLSPAVLHEIGLGRSPEDFEATVEGMRGLPSVMGGPMPEAARRMGLVPGPVTHTYLPQFSGQTVRGGSGGEMVIEPGLASGTLETVRFGTDRGIDFEGTIQVVPIPKEDSADTLVINGSPDLHVEYKPFPGEDLTNTGLLARIPDVFDAEPGWHFAAELPAPRHQLRRA